MAALERRWEARKLTKSLSVRSGQVLLMTMGVWSILHTDHQKSRTVPGAWWILSKDLSGNWIKFKSGERGTCKLCGTSPRTHSQWRLWRWILSTCQRPPSVPRVPPARHGFLHQKGGVCWHWGLGLHSCPVSVASAGDMILLNFCICLKMAMRQPLRAVAQAGSKG